MGGGALPVEVTMTCFPDAVRMGTSFAGAGLAAGVLLIATALLWAIAGALAATGLVATGLVATGLVATGFGAGFAAGFTALGAALTGLLTTLLAALAGGAVFFAAGLAGFAVTLDRGLTFDGDLRLAAATVADLPLLLLAVVFATGFLGFTGFFAAI